MAGEGPMNAELAIVGESPGGEEDKLGRPFVGPSGQIVNELLSENEPEWRRDRIFVTNVVKCRPPGNSTKPVHTKACKDLLLEELSRLPNLRFVVTFGNEPLWALNGKRGISEARGIPFEVELPNRKTITVVPVFHPAASFHNPAIIGNMVEDFDKAVIIARDGVRPAAGVCYRPLVSRDDWEEFFAGARKAKLLACDTETNSLDWLGPDFRLVGASFSFAENTGWFAPVNHKEAKGMPGYLAQQQMDRIREAFALPVRKVFHNWKWDSSVLRRFEIPVVHPWFDTALAWHMLDEEDSQEGGGRLENLAARFTDMGEYKKKALEQEHVTRLELIALSIAVNYASADADATFRLAIRFLKDLRGQKIPIELMDWEMRKGRMLSRLEEAGAVVDWEWHRHCMEKFPRYLSGLKERMRSFPEVLDCEQRFAVMKAGGADDSLDIFGEKAVEPFNPSSHEQKKFLLFEVLGITPNAEFLTDSGKALHDQGKPLTYEHYSTDSLALDYYLADQAISPNARAILELGQDFATSDKIRGTYIEPLKNLKGHDGLIHTEFMGSRMKTWRVSSKRPNLQNLPRVLDKHLRKEAGPNDVKRLYCAPPGWKVGEADYSQLEMRIIGIVAQDKTLQRCYSEDIDIHRMLASRLYSCPIPEVTDDQRSNAKPGNFGCAYLMSARTLAREYGLTMELAEALHDAFWTTFPDYGRYVERMKEEYRETGVARSLFGHVRHLPGCLSDNRRIREGSLRQAVNFPIQCTASCLCLYAQTLLVEWAEEFGMRTQFFGHVHDSIWFRSPEEELDDACEMVRAVMENMHFDFLHGTPAYPVPIPLAADIKTGDNLGQLKKWKGRTSVS